MVRVLLNLLNKLLGPTKQLIRFIDYNEKGTHRSKIIVC